MKTYQTRSSMPEKLGGTPDRLIRLPEVVDRIGFKKSNIYRLIQEDKFPRPVKIGCRASAWKESEIQAWINECEAQSNRKGEKK